MNRLLPLLALYTAGPAAFRRSGTAHAGSLPNDGPGGLYDATRQRVLHPATGRTHRRKNGRR